MAKNLKCYETFGPFEVPRKVGARGKKVLDFSSPSINRFWDDVESEVTGLSKARGCYLFGIRAGRGIKPCILDNRKLDLRMKVSDLTS